MEQEHKIMTMESRIKDVEVEQANVRDHVNRMVDSQERQTAELAEFNKIMAATNATNMVMCERLEVSTEIGKEALKQVRNVALDVNTLKTKDSERIRTEKTYFIGMMVIAIGSCVGAAKAFGVI
jgi:hypothetical protein